MRLGLGGSPKPTSTGLEERLERAFGALGGGRCTEFGREAFTVGSVKDRGVTLIIFCSFCGYWVGFCAASSWADSVVCSADRASSTFSHILLQSIIWLMALWISSLRLDKSFWLSNGIGSTCLIHSPARVSPPILEDWDELGVRRERKPFLLMCGYGLYWEISNVSSSLDKRKRSLPPVYSLEAPDTRGGSMYEHSMSPFRPFAIRVHLPIAVFNVTFDLFSSQYKYRRRRSYYWCATLNHLQIVRRKFIRRWILWWHFCRGIAYNRFLQ
jgi:hypothetical protein